ncbi:hypothetical protein D082_04570 [Synechocystis sp. PCC 6714]|nr:hypothetical protein D082_04570 [Synechocystis sp. PCC 6714]
MAHQRNSGEFRPAERLDISLSSLSLAVFLQEVGQVPSFRPAPMTA